MTAQNGSSTTCNGWVASAVLGTLAIDAAGDGRAHPTGKMGSFELAADVLTTLSNESGRIISIADIRECDDVAVLHVPKAKVQRRDGVKEPSVYPEEVETMLGKPLAEYALV